MAHHVEPMDVDCISSGFDNKENTFHHSNVLPCTEKGYEELDVSELNMKLRYSMTPASSPMSKSYTACLDNKNLETSELLNCSNENTNLTRSLNSTMTKNDSVIKSLKSLPLQSLSTEPYFDGNGNPSILRQLDSTFTDNANLTIIVSGTNDIDENLSLPSSSSSVLHTPEATTPTKEMTKDGGSPIMRGLKSVLNMFRSSQSPIPPIEGNSITVKQDVLSPADISVSENSTLQAVASTPIAANRTKDGNSSKRSSPYKDSIVFSDDLEKELNWKDETTILFSEEKIPIHKLFFQQTKGTPVNKPAGSNAQKSVREDNFNSSVEYMDVSYNESNIKETTMTELQPDNIEHEINVTVESDVEFLDCETTFTKTESQLLDNTDKQMLLSLEPQNLDVTKDIPFETGNKLSANPNKSDENLSFTSGESKNDITKPSDCSDYSKETTEILSELVKLEENVSSNIETSDTNINEDKKIIEQQAETYEIATNVTKESRENQFSITREDEKQVENTTTEELNTNIAESIESKMSCSLEAVSKSITLPEVVHQINTQDNTNVTCDVTLDPKTKSQETQFNITKEVEKQVENTDTEELNTNILESIESKMSYSLKDVSKSVTPPEVVDQINHTQDFTNAACDVTLDPQIVYSDQKILDTMIMQDVKKIENQNMIDSTIPKNTVDTGLCDITNVTLNDIIPESLEKMIMQKPADVPLSDGECQKRLEIMPSSETISGPEMANILEYEKPSDVPLPDEDDVDNEDIITGVPAATSTKTVSVTVPEIFDVAKNLPKLESDNTDTIPKDLLDNFAEDKILKNCIDFEIINTISQDTAIAQLHKVLESKTDLDNTKTFDDKPLEILPESKIGNEVILSEHSKTPSKVDSGMPLASLELTGDFNVLETIDKNNPETLSENEVGNNNTITFDEINIVSDITQIVDDSQCLNSYLVTENFRQKAQNKIGDETTDITKNESLNLTHCLPDVVNQAIVTGDNTKAIETVNMPTTDELALNPNTSNSLEVETKVIPERTENESNCNCDSVKSLSDSTLLNTVTGQQNEEIVIIEKGQVINLPSVNQEQIDKDLEKIQVNDGKISIDVRLSDDQPSETVTNTSTVEQIKLKGTTEDEEIIVSENNSPYVSLMAGVEKDLEKVEEICETIENQFATKTSLASSPPITSKGYNFNFDEMDDPFATKTKLRLSPPPGTPGESKPTQMENEKKMQFEVSKKGVANRRKSQLSERKKAVVMKKKFNNTIDASSATKTSASKIDSTIDDIKDKTVQNTGMNRELSEVKQVKETVTTEIAKPFDALHIIVDEELNEINGKKERCDKFEENFKNIVHKSVEISEENKSSIENIAGVSSDVKSTSSSEQSTYYSAGASSSSTESSKSKNVFNLPEIDDMNFNPFATKSKMRQSPPPELETVNPLDTRTKVKDISDTSMIPPQLDPNCTVTINKTEPAELVKKIDVEDKTETELMEKDSSANISDTTSSSKVTDNQNLTTCEINTEDEDTIEGPFLEPDEYNEKLTDCDADNVDMMQFNDLAAERVDNNLEERVDNNLEDGELFIDAEAFEFLLNQNKSNVVADSGKESLFLKFDPLFAKRISSDAVLAALSKVQKTQSTPTKPIRPSLRNEASPIAGPSSLNLTYECDENISQESTDDVNVTVSKPMMVVTPAVNPAVTPRNKSVTPTRSNRRSITFTSPAIAVIDRLLSMSGNNSLVGQDTSMTQASRDHTEADLALTQLRELLAEKEISVYNLRSESKELKDRLAAMETQVRILEADGQDRLKKIKELEERLVEKTKINKSMADVVEEYERTIASLIAETEQDKKRHAEERLRLINDRDEQTAHLASMEVSFSDLHSKYEKSKQVIFTCKANEDSYKKSLKEFEENLTKMQTNYETLKQHATSKLNHANHELEKINRAHEAEVVKLSTMIKRKDLHITSLEETLAQKTKANEELTAICDELINKVG